MKKVGFTLIELIVVITILAILGTIAFISFNGYAGEARDSKVVSDVTNIHKGLSVEKIKKGVVPVPENTKDLSITSGTIISHQGEVGDNIRRVIKVSSEGISPKGINYEYITNGTRKFFTIQGAVEKLENNIVEIEGKSRFIKGDSLLSVYNSSSEFVDGNVDGAVTGATSAVIGDTKLTVNSETVSDIPSEIKENKTVSSTSGDGGSTPPGPTLTGWRAIDSSCPHDDITIGSQTWAGCNSIAGAGMEWGKKADGSDGTILNCFTNYDGTPGDNSDCAIGAAEMASTANPKAWFTGTNGNGDGEFNTIWGKLYTYQQAMGTHTDTNGNGMIDVSEQGDDGACPAGRHIPSEQDFRDLDALLTTNNSGDNNTGWKGHGSKDNTNNMANALKIPLSGYNKNGYSHERGSRTTLWNNTYSDSSAEGIFFTYNESAVFMSYNVSSTKDIGSSVRCIKD